VTELRVGLGPEVEILGNVGLVVPHNGLIGEAEVLGMQHIDALRDGAGVAQPDAPGPAGLYRMQAEGRGALKRRAGDGGVPGGGAGIGGETEAGANQRGPAERGAGDVGPAHQQAEETVLRRSGQQLVEHRLAMPEGVKRAGGQQLGAQAAGGGELLQVEIGGTAEFERRGGEQAGAHGGGHAAD